MFDANNSGTIQFKYFFPLLRNLGYNVHKEEAWDHLNELELSGTSRNCLQKQKHTNKIT